MHAMIMAVGLEAIGQGIGAEDRVLWQAQIGVTRIGAGGRALPRCRNGRMTTSEGLIAATFEPQEFVTLARRPRKSAPLARAIAFLTVAVVARVEDALRGLTGLAAFMRALWRALVPPRQVVSKRALAAWESAREMGIKLPSVWRAVEPY
jgi:hypothetical protein